MADTVFMIALTPTMESGKITKWNKKEGDTIKEGEVICEIETDKSSMEYESLNEGTILKILISEGENAKVGDVIAIVGLPNEDVSDILKDIDQSDSKKEKEATKTPSVELPGQQREYRKVSKISSDRIKASPLAKKIAKQKGIDISTVKGTGPNGRILQRDVETHRGHESTLNISDIIVGENKEIKVEGVRAVIAQRLSESKFSAPHFYLKVSVSMEQIIDLRNNANKKRERKLSMNAVFIKLVAETLKRNPAINASLQETKIVQFGSIDIGLAVDLGNGLITPIVKNCAYKGIGQIDNELQDRIEKVRNGTISSDEYNGATFTISNLGSFGVDEFTAIINPPGSAILAIGRNKKTPVVCENGEIGVENLMTLTLSCDHRVIDGINAARFLSNMKSVFENPAVALL